MVSELTLVGRTILLRDHPNVYRICSLLPATICACELCPADRRPMEREPREGVARVAQFADLGIDEPAETRAAARAPLISGPSR